MVTQEEKNAVLSINQKNMERELAGLRNDVKSIDEKLDRNFEKFQESASTTYASKMELGIIATKVNDLSALMNKIMFGLLSSSVVIIISLIVFIYLNNVK